jgi:phosphonoacetaldehyde dehydrogenase
VGKLIAHKAGYRRAMLELGGNDPLIVLADLDDDDLDRAAKLAVEGATKNSGQRCTAVKRVLVHEAVADRFAALVADKARAIRFGDPMDPETDLGTVITKRPPSCSRRASPGRSRRGRKCSMALSARGRCLPRWCSTMSITAPNW